MENALRALRGEALIPGIREQFELFLVITLPRDGGYDFDCMAWSGPCKAPTREGGEWIPALFFNNKVYTASLVSWALHHQQDYPYAYALYSCDDYRCVNPYHVRPYARRLQGRPRHYDLSQTTHYNERYTIITELLKFSPRTTADEIISQLQSAGIGGKTKTILAIIAKVRSELGLPLRIPSRRPRQREGTT